MGPVLWIAPTQPTLSQQTPFTLGTEFRALSVNANTDHGHEQLFDGRLVQLLRIQPRPWLSLDGVYSSTARYFTANQQGHSIFAPVDLELAARIQPSTPQGHRLVLGAGIKLGLAPSLLDELGFNRPIQLQINAASPSVLANVEYQGTIGAWTGFSSLRALLPSTGRFHWRQGASLQASVGFRYRFNSYVLAGVSVDPRAVLADTVELMTITGTGGVILSTTPTLLIQPSPTVTLSFAMSFPVAQWYRQGTLDGIGFSLGFQWTPVFTQPVRRGSTQVPTRALIVG